MMPDYFLVDNKTRSRYNSLCEFLDKESIEIFLSDTLELCELEAQLLEKNGKKELNGKEFELLRRLRFREILNDLYLRLLQNCRKDNSKVPHIYRYTPIPLEMKVLLVRSWYSGDRRGVLKENGRHI